MLHMIHSFLNNTHIYIHTVHWYKIHLSNKFQTCLVFIDNKKVSLKEEK